ncbi:MAG: DUF885 domain-containing protein [Candidatus Cloacimonadota bacterium]|nr:MAG: DUF885 domain-containing protein [Candidatus Cloacimonadota bacterium]
MKKLLVVIFLFSLLSCQGNEISISEVNQPGKPESIEQLFDDYFKIAIALNPETGSYLGLDSEGEYPFNQSKLTDRSETAYKKEIKIIKQYRSWLDNFNDLTQQQEIEAAIFCLYLDNIIKKVPFHRSDYVINCNFGLHINLQTIMTEYHKIYCKQDALDYISRLNDFQMIFDNLLIDMEYQKKEGIIPPREIIDRTIDELDDMISEDLTENIFYSDFVKKIEILNLSESERNALLKQAESAVKESVLPNLQNFADKISNIKKRADDIPGLWKIPGGNKLYQHYLNVHTTTDMTPEEIHQLGLKEVERIQQEILQRFAELGFTDGKTYGKIKGEYWNSLQGSKYTFSYGETGKNQALNYYLQILEETKPKLKNYFSKLPQTEVTVKRVPAHKEQFTGAHYKRAPIDGSEPAAFYANLGWTPKKPGMATLLYHETIPGHHLQIAYAMEFCNVPIYRNFTHFTAFIEGWALYAERLAFENGWHKDIYSEIGYLESELYRAVRLVVDTGIHYKKWTRTKAYNYMVSNLGWGSYGDIDRYTLWPGQACAYKIGELKILELRRKAKEKLGNDFDIKEFHEIVLKNGAIPLDLLEKVVNTWLKKQLSRVSDNIK